MYAKNSHKEKVDKLLEKKFTKGYDQIKGIYFSHHSPCFIEGGLMFQYGDFSRENLVMLAEVRESRNVHIATLNMEDFIEAVLLSVLPYEIKIHMLLIAGLSDESAIRVIELPMGDSFGMRLRNYFDYYFGNHIKNKEKKTSKTY